MKKMNIALKLAVALLALTLGTSAFADQPPDNVQGNWTIYATNAENGETVVKHVQIAQYGNRITGYFEGPFQSGPIQGEVNGHRIRFNTVTRTVLHFWGQIYGDNMSGTCGVRGKHAPWQAVRPATTAAVVPVPPSTGTVYSSQPVLTPPEAQTVYQPATYQAPVQQTYQAQPTYQSQPTYQPQPYQSSPSYQPAPAPAAQPGQQQPANDSAQGSAPTAPTAPVPAPLTPDQLNSLVAPIALYPDALVAQVLAAATNPDQVAYADDWLAQNRNLTGQALAQAVDQQSWDPSVKALTQFPSVLDNMAHNLSWTSSLGQAFANQQSDVMAAVQVMRARAQAAGSLQSNSQITVTTPAANTIVIQPANPQVVYVPQYNPTVVYGAPVVVPYYVPPVLPVSVGVGLYFGTPITIGAWFGGAGWGGGFGWGWHAWGLHWGCCGGSGSTTIIYNHTTYINNHTWNNTNYNGYHPWSGGAAGSQNHAWYGNNGTFHPDGNYKPGEDTHYGPNGGYHPNGYFGPDGGWHPDKPGTGPANMPNGGNNGNHGLIGGNGGVQHDAPNGGAVGSQNHAWYGNNGTFHPDGNYKPGEDTHYGPNGGYHPNGYFGPDGGYHSDKPGTGPSNMPNGGNNGNHGLIGGNGGTQHAPANNGGQMLGQSRNDSSHFGGADQNRSRFSGDGAANRMESNRGRDSMAGRRPQQHMARMHAPAQHRSFGGGGRRR